MPEAKYIEDPVAPELTYPDGLLKNLLKGRNLWRVPLAIGCALIMGSEVFNRLEAIPPGFSQAVNYGYTATEGGITLREFDSLLFQFFQKSGEFDQVQSFLADPASNYLDIERIQRLGRLHTEYGLNLARVVLPVHEAASISVSADQQEVSFMGRSFDMNHPLHPHILNALLGSRMELHRMRLENEEFARYQPAWFIDERTGYRETEANNLLWLYDQNLPISVDNDAYAILPYKHVVYLAGILREFSEAGLPLPRRITYSKWTEKDFGYVRENGKIKVIISGYYMLHQNDSDKRHTIVLSNRAPDFGILEEVGHFASDAVYLEPSNPRLIGISQATFNEGFNEKAPVFSSFWEVKTGDMEHEYTGALIEYFLRGYQFRRNLQEKKENDPYVYQLGAFEYEFMRAVFGGDEFFSYGMKGKKRPVDSLVQVNDPDQNTPGVLIRVAIDSEFDPELPAVFHGDLLQITGRSRILKDRYGVERNYWQIRVVGVGDKNKELTDGASLGAEGWLPDKYFMPVPS